MASNLLLKIYIIFFLTFTNISVFYLYPLILDSWGSTSAQIGLVMGLFSAIAVLSRPFMGIITSKKGEFIVMLLGTLLILFSSLTYSIIDRVGTLLYINRMLHGLGFSGMIAGGFSFLAKASVTTNRGIAFSRVGACIMGAVAFIPPVCESLILRYGFNSLYVFASLISLVLIACVFSLKKESDLEKAEFSVNARGYISLIKDERLSLLLLSTFVFSHMQATVINFIAVYAMEKGVKGGPFFFIAFSIAVVILLFSGRLLDYFGIMGFLKIFYSIFTADMFIIPFLMVFKSGIIPAVLFGIALGFVFPSLNAIAAGFGHPADKPKVMSLFTAVYDTGFISGAMISGWIGNLFNMDMIFYSSAIIGLTGLIPILLNRIKSH